MIDFKKTWKNRKKLAALLRKKWFEMLVRILILPIMLLLLFFSYLGELADKMVYAIDANLTKYLQK